MKIYRNPIRGQYQVAHQIKVKVVNRMMRYFRIFMSISVNKFVSLYYRIIYKQLNTLSITLRSTAKDTSYIMPGVMISCTHSEVQLNKTMRLLLFT
jgi:hypothetical protein